MEPRLQNQPTPGSGSEQERRAHDYLAQGRFRKARDEYKLLCKVDRPKFLPLLVEANLGLAREMLGKGMLSEAQQLANYLKTIATPEQMLTLEVELRGQAGASGTMVPTMLKALEASSLNPLERQRLADQVVLAFAQPIYSGTAEALKIAEELASVMAGLQAVAERNFERAQDLIRPLGQTSAFSHWKVFIKGLIAFHNGHLDKATLFFSSLATATVPGKASQAYLLLLGAFPVSNNSPLPSEAAVEAACKIAGQAGCGRALLGAERAWRQSDPVQMYQSLRRGIPDFPVERLDFLGVLSEFAVNCLFGLPCEVREDFLDLVEDSIQHEQTKNAVELMLFLRAAVLDDAPSMPDPVVIEFWERFLQIRKQLHGPNPFLESEAYGWLGHLMSRPGALGGSAFDWSGENPAMRNGLEAQKFLEKAVTLDTGNLSACLNLCEVYQQLRKHSDRNRLLDHMAALFPTEKKVLLLAGQTCLERKTFKKALDYFYQALALDRLDPAIPDRIVNSRFLQAWEYLQKDRPEDARKTMQETARFEVVSAGNLTRSRWVLKTREGLFELLAGDPARGETLLAEARTASPAVAAFLFFAGFIALEMAPRDRRCEVYFDELARMAKSEATAAEAILLTRVWSHSKECIAQHLVRKPRKLLEKFLRSAAQRPCSRDDAVRLAEFGLAAHGFSSAVLPFLQRQLVTDRDDPLFRLYRLRLKPARQSNQGLNQLRRELESILLEASRRKDDSTVRLARQQLDALKIPAPQPPRQKSTPWDEEPEDIFDAPEGAPSMEAIFDIFPKKARRLMREFFNIIANASEKEIEKMRATRPADMSEAEFETVVLLARGSSGAPTTRSLPDVTGGSQSCPPPVVPRDPRQPDLFEQ